MRILVITTLAVLTLKAHATSPFIDSNKFVEVEEPAVFVGAEIRVERQKHPEVPSLKFRSSGIYFSSYKNCRYALLNAPPPENRDATEVDVGPHRKWRVFDLNDMRPGIVGAAKLSSDGLQITVLADPHAEGLSTFQCLEALGFPAQNRKVQKVKLHREVKLENADTAA